MDRVTASTVSSLPALPVLPMPFRLLAAASIALYRLESLNATSLFAWSPLQKMVLLPRLASSRSLVSLVDSFV